MLLLPNHDHYNVFDDNHDSSHYNNHNPPLHDDYSHHNVYNNINDDNILKHYNLVQHNNIINDDYHVAHFGTAGVQFTRDITCGARNRASGRLPGREEKVKLISPQSRLLY